MVCRRLPGHFPKRPFSIWTGTCGKWGPVTCQVGRKVKSLAEALYGRFGAYAEGLENDDGALADALQRNFFAEAEGHRMRSSLSCSSYAVKLRFWPRSRHRFCWREAS